MKILISISLYHPYVSGLTICAKNYAEGLAEKGHSITVLTTQHDKELSQKEFYSRVHVKRVPYLFKIHKGFFMPNFFQKAWQFVGANDVVIINLPQFEAWILAGIAVIRRKKIISIYHCEVALPKGFYNRIIENVLLIANWITLFLSTSIVTYTKDYAYSTRLLPLFKDKCHYISPPIHTPQISKNLQNEIVAKIPKDRIVLGIAARVSAEKGFEYLFSAIPFLESLLKQHIVILIAGPKNTLGEENYWKILDTFIRAYHDQIIFLGSIPSESLGAFYSILHVLVLPSVNKTEAFGMVQVEAMFLGTPCVVSDLPGVRIPTMLTGMGERFKIKDPKDLAEKIAHVVSNRHMYTQGVQKAKELFSFKNAIDAMENLLIA